MTDPAEPPGAAAHPELAEQPEQDDDEGVDRGPHPFVTDIREATLANDTFRTAQWTGTHLQLTVMSLGAGEDIGLEVHHDIDQLVRVEEGVGRVEMGPARDRLTFRREVRDDDVVLVPAGSWHNITNTGPGPLDLSSVYGPAEHPPGTVHTTKAEADEAEAHHDH